MSILTVPIPRTIILGFLVEMILIMKFISTKYGFQTSSYVKTKTATISYTIDVKKRFYVFFILK